MRQTGQHGGSGDLVAVEMQDGQHRAIARRVEEFVGMPTRGARTGFGFAIAHDAAGDEIGIIENRAVRVQNGVAEFAAFVNGAGRFRGGVAGNAAGE